jgi:hypothetical protein
MLSVKFKVSELAQAVFYSRGDWFESLPGQRLF